MNGVWIERCASHGVILALAASTGGLDAVVSGERPGRQVQLDVRKGAREREDLEKRGQGRR